MLVSLSNGLTNLYDALSFCGEIVSLKCSCFSLALWISTCLGGDLYYSAARLSELLAVQLAIYLIVLNPIFLNK